MLSKFRSFEHQEQPRGEAAGVIPIESNLEERQRYVKYHRF